MDSKDKQKAKEELKYLKLSEEDKMRVLANLIFDRMLEDKKGGRLLKFPQQAEGKRKL